MRVLLLGVSLLFAAVPAWGQSQLKLGAKPPEVTLKGDDGELVKNGEAWNSAGLVGKVTMIVYVDPDEADLNEPLADRLKAEAFPLEAFQSVALINMAATWKPNMAISSVLKGKQEKFPHTVYVKDYKKVMTKVWGLQDDAYHVLLLDKDGALIYDKAGKFSAADIDSFVRLIKDKMAH